MKPIVLIFILFFSITEKLMAQNLEDPVAYMPWGKIVLNNQASFEKMGELNWGSGFLINYKNGVIACTARDFTGTTYTPGEMLLIKDFEKELKYWKMYISDNPDCYVFMDSLIMKERMEKSFSIFLYSRPYLTFSIKEMNSNIIALDPNLEKVKNTDTLYLVGYDDAHNLKIVEGIVETALNEKYADPEIRMKTDIFLYYNNFVGAPVVNKNGKVVGVINRAYRLNKNKRGNIINDDKTGEGAHFEYYVNGTSIRSILGKDYNKK